MTSGRTPSLSWILPLTVAVVAVLSNWAWRTKPPTTLVCRTKARTSAVLAAADPTATAAWRLVIRLDRDVEAPAWLLHENPQAGGGYELHWLPQLLAFQLSRAGDQPQLLGTATIDRAPRQISLQRRGPRLAVEVDGQRVLDCLDLLTPPAPAGWGFLAAADTGGVTISLYDERRLLAPAERALLAADSPAALLRAVADEGLESGPEHAVARARLAVALAAVDGGGAAAERAQRDALVALRALGERHPDHPALAAWLRWNEVRLAVGREDEALATAIDGLIAFAAGARAREVPGLLLDLMRLASERACARPAKATPPDEVLAVRQRWLHTVAALGYAAMDAEGPDAGFVAPENLHWMLRLAVQAADCLAGDSPQPTPAEGPAWLASRWRAFSGRNPGVATLPDLPGGWRERNPLLGTVQRLTEFAGFEPLAAVAMRGDVLAAVGRGDRAAADEAVARAPAVAARQATLTRALLALRDLDHPSRGRLLPTVNEALEALERDDGEGSPLANDDPLGFALDRLLRHRARRAAETLGIPTVPEPLAWAERLLNGKPGATAESWRVLPDRPIEGLAAALAMQEVAGESPNWSLLDRATCFTVPLRLLAPVSRPTPVQPQPEPSPDPPPAVVP